MFSAMSMTSPDSASVRIIPVAEGWTRLRDAAPTKFAELFQHGSLSVEIYRPGGVDDQTPHARDELYVVLTGSGEFTYGGRRATIAAGDCLFVAAGVEHRFENFTADLAVWVFFYGPEGGEAPDPR